PPTAPSSPQSPPPRGRRRPRLRRNLNACAGGAIRSAGWKPALPGAGASGTNSATGCAPWERRHPCLHSQATVGAGGSVFSTGWPLRPAVEVAVAALFLHALEGGVAAGAAAAGGAAAAAGDVL